MNMEAYMDYLTLKKIYYKESLEVYRKIYHDRFNSEYTKRFDFEIHGQEVFFIELPEISNLIIDIYKLDRGICELRAELPKVALSQFTRRCLVDEIILTNNIEGVNSTRKEIDDVLNDLSQKNKKKRFYGLVQKYLMLQKKDDIPLENCEDIRQIYDELVLKEVVSENPEYAPDGKLFRKESVSVTNYAQKEIHQGIYPEDKIITAMDKALSILNDDSIQFLVRIAMFHYFIGYIHPFYDGNGRLGRFISSYLLSKDLDPLIGYRLSFTIKENLSSYYKAFKDTNDSHNKADLTPFIITFLEIILKAEKQLYLALLERMESLIKYQNIVFKTKNLVSDKNKDLIYILIQAALFSDKGVCTKDLLDNLFISRTTLSKRLNYIKKKSLLVATKDGTEKYYKFDLEQLGKISSEKEAPDL